MEGQNEYANVSELLEKIEGERGAGANVLIDPSAALANEVTIESYDYDKACSIIGGIETVVIEQQAASQRPQIQIPSVSVNTQAVTQTASQIRQKIGDAQIQKRILTVNKEMLDAAREIGGIVGGAGMEIEKSIQESIKNAKAKKLILPNLSLQDQIDELEGINEGLDQGAFDAQQLRIVSQEIAGTKEVAKGQRFDESQAEMGQLRDKLLLEIGNKLLSTNN
ncbi:MAG: hypothetical protein KGH53_00280 [Candidatus Micrarchaeota archaeon]|nr:hypothetical protein [Candidatus Micrarchaeota archaeon]